MILSNWGNETGRDALNGSLGERNEGQSVASREKNVYTTWRKAAKEGQQAGRSVHGTDLQDLWTAKKKGLSLQKSKY